MTKHILPLFLFSLCLLLSISCGGSKYPAKSPVVTHMGKASVALIVEKDDGSYHSYCSGSWVGERGILTAYHCIDALADHMSTDEKTVKPADVKVHYIVEGEVMGVGEEPSGLHLAAVSVLDEKHDLALLKAVGNAVPAHDAIVLSKMAPEVGDRVFSMGTPRGLYWTLTDGIVSAYRDDLKGIGDDNEGPFMQVSVQINSGNSGGGVYNEWGELVGVADGTLRNAEGLHFCISLSRIREFVEKNHAYTY